MIYYNDNDPKVCAWLRELIAAGELPEGHVDSRSILEVKGDELEGFTQCHFFAGIGGWPLALRWAGIEGVAGIWTGSCPCQPLSSAGQRKGHADERHLWPAFHDLIAKRRPATVFGEQVASKDGREWFAGVRLDLEDLGYACGGADLCAAGVGAPHRRQRLYWVADANLTGCDRWPRSGEQSICNEDDEARRMDYTAGAGFSEQRRTFAIQAEHGPTQCPSRASCVADSKDSNGGSAGGQNDSRGRNQETGGCCQSGCMADTECDGGRSDKSRRKAKGRTADGRSCGLGDAEGRGCGECGNAAQPGRGGHADRPGWARYDIIPCRDGKARRVEAGTFPLAHGIPGRMGLLRGYGNAIVPENAEVFVRAWMECRLKESQR